MKLFESLLFFARLRPIIKDLLLSSLNVKIFVRKLSRNCLDINHDRLVLFIYLFIYLFIRPNLFIYSMALKTEQYIVSISASANRAQL